jgi:uncharacterized membrane protein
VQITITSKFSNYKLIFTAASLIGLLLIATPLLSNIIHLQEREKFSELYLLGPEKMAQNLPFNITPNQTYTTYLGVGNHMGETTYYTCKIKLRNQTENPPDSSTQTPSSLPTLYEYNFIIPNGENHTEPLTFSTTTTPPTKNITTLKTLTLNDINYNIDKTAQYDPDNKGYYYQLFIELWAYNPTTQTTQYQNRWVYLWLNTTTTTNP